MGLCSHLAHLWALFLILPPALRRWGSPRRQGLCSHLAHKWANSDSAPPLYSGGYSGAWPY